MSNPVQVQDMSSGNAEFGGIIPANETFFFKMREIWTGGNCSTARVCFTLQALNTQALTTYTIGSVAANPMVGFAQGDTGAAYAPPTSASGNWDIAAEGRGILAFTQHVGVVNTLTNYGSGLRRLDAGTSTTNTMRPRLNASAHGGMTLTNPAESSIACFGFGAMSAIPYTNSTSPVFYCTLTMRRITATQFGMKLVWAGGSSPSTWDSNENEATADVITKVENRANGTTVPPNAASFPEFIVNTTTTDPRTIFAQYPWFCLQNPFPIPLYILHIATFESA